MNTPERDGDGARVVALLNRLAHNMYWAWHHDARRLFSELNPDLWRIVGRNPVALLRDLGPDRVAHASSNGTAVIDVRTSIRRGGSPIR